MRMILLFFLSFLFLFSKKKKDEVAAFLFFYISYIIVHEKGERNYDYNLLADKGFWIVVISS